MEELEKLFNVLTREGYYTKSFEDFQVQFNDPVYQDKVYNVVSRDNLFTRSKDEFISKYGVKKKEIRDYLERILHWCNPNWKNKYLI